MASKKISLETARSMLCDLEKTNEIFSVCFTKRENGEDRCMNCRFKVASALKSGKKSFSDAKHNLFTVYDLKNVGYRSISMEGVKEIKRKGKTFLINREEEAPPKKYTVKVFYPPTLKKFLAGKAENSSKHKYLLW